MALTIGLTKSITLHGASLPNAFFTIRHLGMANEKISVNVTVYFNQATWVADPEDFIESKVFDISLTANQNETFYNAVYSRLLAQIGFLSGATVVT